MDGMQQIFSYLSFFVWISLFVVVLYQWIVGLFDYRQMLKIFSVVFAIALGFFLFEHFFSSHTASIPELKCNEIKLTENFMANSSYYDCIGWPVFLESFVSIAEKIMKFLAFFYGFSTVYVQYVVAFFILSRFVRKIWTVDFKQIFFCFVGGTILYVSLTNLYEIQLSINNMTSFLLGFQSHFAGTGDSSVTAAMSNFKNWYKAFDDLKTISSIHGARFGSGSITDKLDIFKSFSAQWDIFTLNMILALIKIPLFVFSGMNILMILMQGVLIMAIPVDVIKMILSAHFDPLVVVRKLFAISMLSILLVAEMNFLTWFPDAPIIDVDTESALGLFEKWGLLFKAGGFLFVLILFMIFGIFIAISTYRNARESVNSVNNQA